MRVATSVAIAIHLLAVFTGPWSNPPPSTQISRDLADMLSPYIKLMSLDNGYRFFAPDPGPSHLVRYELRFEDGTRKSEIFPDLRRHWPRLLYHRHFMLSETLFSMSSAILDAPSIATMTESERQAFAQQQQMVERLQQGVAQHLLNLHPEAKNIRLFGRVHSIPAMSDVLRGQPLDDPNLYREFLLGEFAR